MNKQKIGVTFKVMAGGQLGKSERAYIEGMQQGSIQMAQVSTGPMAGFVGEFDILVYLTCSETLNTLKKF